MGKAEEAAIHATVILVGLKLMGELDWEWPKVFIPMVWLAFVWLVAALFVLGGMLLGAIFGSLIERDKAEER